MVNLKELKKILAEMLHSRPLLKERRKLQRISTNTERDSTKVQTGYLPVTSMPVTYSFFKVKYRMQYNSHEPLLQT
jgi:hypothetical protein